MDERILTEIQRFAGSFWLGAGMTAGYQLILLLRKPIKHKSWMSICENFLFWMVCSYVLFDYLDKVNKGIFRMDMLFGMLIGMIIVLQIWKFMLTQITKVLTMILCKRNGKKKT